MSNTNISWCVNADGTKGKVWNPVIGCTPAGEGCRNCYAARLHNTRHKAYKAGKLQSCRQYAKPFSEIQLHRDRLETPTHWKKPQTVFVNSMSDLFHRDVPFSFISAVFDRMADCPRHTFIILAKRPERMRAFMHCWVYEGNEPPRNVTLGASCSTQAEVDRCLEQLHRTPCAYPGVSLEPLVEGIKLGTNLKWLKWVIVGGESGPNARPMHPDWVRSLRDECAAAGVPFFFKQWGEWLPFRTSDVDKLEGVNGTEPVCLLKKNGRAIRPYSHADAPGHEMVRVGIKRAGRTLDGRTHDELAWRAK